VTVTHQLSNESTDAERRVVCEIVLGAPKGWTEEHGSYLPVLVLMSVFQVGGRGATVAVSVSAVEFPDRIGRNRQPFGARQSDALPHVSDSLRQMERFIGRSSEGSY
jgi:hypothetical protein